MHDQSLLKLAKSSEGQVLTNGAFLVTQIPFFVLLVLGAAGIRALAYLTYPEGSHGLGYLVVVIHGLALVGVGFALFSLAKVEIEHALAKITDDNATKELERIKGGERGRIALDRVGDLLVHNPGRAMMRLFEHILKEAHDRRFDSSILVMQPFRDETYEEIIRLQNFRRLALQLGILGTFIGLMLALTEMGSSGDQQIDLQVLIESLDIAFSTSIAGLEVAVLIGLMLMWVRYRQAAYFKQMQNATVAVISLARNAINPDDFLAGLGEASTAMRQLEARVNDQRAEVRTLTHRIKDGIGALAQTRAEFDGFLKKVSETQAGFIGEMSKLYKVLSPVTVARQLQTGLDKAVEQIAATFDTTLMQSLEGLTELRTSITILGATLTDLEKRLQDQATHIETGNTEWLATKRELQATMTQILDAHQAFITEVKTVSMEDMGRRLEGSILVAGDQVSRQLKTDVEKMSGMIGQLNLKLSDANLLIDEFLTHRPIRRFVFRVVRPARRSLRAAYESLKERLASTP